MVAGSRRLRASTTHGLAMSELILSKSTRRSSSHSVKTARTDAEREQIMKDYQAALTDKQNQEIAPLVDKTRDAIADVAHKKGLLLVIDRSNLIYGGTDITSDVTSELK